MPTIQSLDDLEEAPHAIMFDGDEPRTIRLSLDAGERVPEHDHPDRTILIHVIEGALDFTLGGDTHELTAGDVIRFDGDQGIAPEAREDTRALVVLADRAE